MVLSHCICMRSDLLSKFSSTITWSPLSQFTHQTLLDRVQTIPGSGLRLMEARKFPLVDLWACCRGFNSCLQSWIHDTEYGWPGKHKTQDQGRPSLELLRSPPKAIYDLWSEGETRRGDHTTILQHCTRIQVRNFWPSLTWSSGGRHHKTILLKADLYSWSRVQLLKPKSAPTTHHCTPRASFEIFMRKQRAAMFQLIETEARDNRAWGNHREEYYTSEECLISLKIITAPFLTVYKTRSITSNLIPAWRRATTINYQYETSREKPIPHKFSLPFHYLEPTHHPAVPTLTPSYTPPFPNLPSPPHPFHSK